MFQILNHGKFTLYSSCCNDSLCEIENDTVVISSSIQLYHGQVTRLAITSFKDCARWFGLVEIDVLYKNMQTSCNIGKSAKNPANI